MKSKFRGRLQLLLLVISLLALLASLSASIIKVTVIHTEQLKLPEISEVNNSSVSENEVVQTGASGGSKRPDRRCLFWSTKRLNSGWFDNPYPEQDFFIDYYVPAGKKALICTTPALTVGVSRFTKKRLIDQVFSSRNGWRVRVILGLSEVREPCKTLTGNVNCVNSLLLRQAVVRYSP